MSTHTRTTIDDYWGSSRACPCARRRGARGARRARGGDADGPERTNERVPRVAVPVGFRRRFMLHACIKAFGNISHLHVTACASGERRQPRIGDVRHLHVYHVRGVSESVTVTRESETAALTGRPTLRHRTVVKSPSLVSLGPSVLVEPVPPPAVRSSAEVRYPPRFSRKPAEIDVRSTSQELSWPSDDSANQPSKRFNAQREWSASSTEPNWGVASYKDK